MLHSSKTKEETIMLDLFLEHLKKEHKLSKKKIDELLKKIREKKQEAKEKIMLPVSIFNQKLSALETIVKYLVENKNMQKNKIAIETNRNINTIWTTYNNASRKEKKKLIITKKESEDLFIPLTILKNRKFSTLENIIVYLKKECMLGFKEISRLLKRKESTIRTTYNRAKKKKDE